MVQVLSDPGHLAWTLEQVQAKVKELCLGYVQATEGKGAGADTCPHYDHIHAILEEMVVPGPSPAVDTGLHTPVVRPPDLEEEEGGLTTGSEDEGEDCPITLHLEPVPSSQDVSRASSEAGDGSSTGPPRSEGPSSSAAAAPTTQAPVRWARQHDQLLQQHVQAVERMEAAVTTKTQADLEWRQQAWGQFLHRCDRMYDTISALMSHIGHAIHYGMTLPHLPAVPMPPPAKPTAAVAMPPPAAPPAAPPDFPPAAVAVPPPAAPVLPTSLCCLPQPGLKDAEAFAPAEALAGAAPPSSEPLPLPSPSSEPPPTAHPSSLL